MTESDFIPSENYKVLTQGSVTYQSPSNIALVKYWGKHGEQLPQNPSISFTLSNCHTTTTLTYKKTASATGEIEFDVLLDGKSEPDFKPKIAKFFERIEKYIPFVKEYSYVIDTANSFPHSSGIASSASGMSALALCLMEIERQSNPDMTPAYFLQKASFLARLGSGSACRSLDGPLVVWGNHKEISNSSDIFGTSYNSNVHDNFKNYQDTILLVDKGEKQVSSTVGHGLMHGHAFAKARFSQAHDNLSELMRVFEAGDVDAFIKLVESEALTLHAMMMTSHPYFILMKPKTLEIINEIWDYRQQTGSKVCFTLDAGANVHVLYPENEKYSVQDFIAAKLSKFCQNGHYINDFVGNGAKKL
ncbi:diphosphomevalonate decarboxylase [Dokdonia sp. MED134]|uniref:diphosphomevalonate/mevalonate 3,5-bisphosphate decarboxylase family protein n=1 Tax=Dokdonia sp. MED134 TaxID=313590 RepID=UPI000068BFD8|nr:diphosphomevalonate decarboxylase [Dokdonia sp. MED134]EAQ38188.1 diphosphomevalonate decarboxylase [Dokdonia sp. MED134]